MRYIPASAGEAAKQETLFLLLFRNEPLRKEALFSALPKKEQAAVARFAAKRFSGDEEEVKSLWLPDGAGARIFLVGLGERGKWNERKCRTFSRKIVQWAKREKARSFAVSLPPSKMDGNERARNFATETALADFEYTRYKTAPQEGWPNVHTITLAAALPRRVALAALREGSIIGEETNACRELANTPGGDMTPRHLAAAAENAGRRAGVHVKTLDTRAIQKLKMGGILGVARGSSEKPRFIIMEYMKGPKGQKPLVLVGKGVTFDTGGLNLKPNSAIYEMHMDMSGGAAVIHGIAAIARLALHINVIGLIPSVENMPSGSSYRPGDVLRAMSGKTIEVLNTDAEGRIILADALCYGKTRKPGFMADFATLTGAAHAALGNHASALFTNRETLQEKLIRVGERSGDYVWPLPLWDEYLPEIKGTFGDIANIGKPREGDAIHGAKFLEQFVGETPWAHIDIAPKMTALDSEYLAKGASGVGVRYIAALAKEYPNIMRDAL